MSVISSRDEYLFINPVDLPEDLSSHGKAPGNILYGGDIMPLRDAEDKTLRGIDPLFIVNRVNMMHSLHEGFLARGVRFFRRVDYRNLLRARESLVNFYTTGEYYSRYSGGLCGFPKEGIYEVDWSSRDVFAQIPGALADIKWKSDAAAFAKGAPLRKSDMLDLFDDCNQNHICVKRSSRHECRTTKFNHSYQGGGLYADDPGPTSTPADVVYDYIAKSTTDTSDDFYEIEDDTSECDVKFSVMDSDVVGDLTLPATAFPSVIRNVVYFNASMEHNPEEGITDGSSFNSYYALVSDASAADGVYSTSIQDIKSVVAKAKKDFGFKKINLHGDHGESTYIRVSFMGMDSVIEVPPQYDWKR